jgi:hypothetical protein
MRLTSLYICQKFGIETVASEAKVVLERPAYAAGSRFDIELNDETDRYWETRYNQKLCMRC